MEHVSKGPSTTCSTTNSVEGWHNAFQTSIVCSQPIIGKFLKALQREQSLHEAFVTKWEAGERRVHTKKTVEHNERIRALVSDYENRETLTYLNLTQTLNVRSIHTVACLCAIVASSQIKSLATELD